MLLSLVSSFVEVYMSVGSLLSQVWKSDIPLIHLQIFGFLNLLLWAGNCWFIYKETPFHKDPIPVEGGPAGP